MTDLSDDPVTRLACIIEAAIEQEPMHRRLYPDYYAREVARAVLDRFTFTEPDESHP